MSVITKNKYGLNILEKDIEQYLKRQCTKFGMLCFKFNSPGKVGVPDRIIIFSGMVFFVECKAPAGKVTPNQASVHAEMLKRGVTVSTVKTFAEVDALLSVIISIANA